jgi:hypothetical protein
MVSALLRVSASRRAGMDERNPQRDSDEVVGREREDDDRLADDSEEFEDVDEIGDEDADDSDDIEE